MRDFFLKKISQVYILLLSIFINVFIYATHKTITENIIYNTYEKDLHFFFITLNDILFFLPFVLFYPIIEFFNIFYFKKHIMKLLGFLLFLLSLIICISYYNHIFWLILFLNFLLALFNSFYFPIFYAYILKIIQKQFVLKINLLIGIGSALAILIAFGISYFYLNKNNIFNFINFIGISFIILSLINLALSYKLSILQEKKIAYSLKRYLKKKIFIKNLKSIIKEPILFPSILGISIFLLLLESYIILFPIYVRDILLEDSLFYLYLNFIFLTIGFIFGSFVFKRFSISYLEFGFIPFALFGSCILTLLLPYILNHFIIFFLFGFCGSFVIIPFFTLIQLHSQVKKIQKVILVNNFLQSTIILSCILTIFLLVFIKFNLNYIFYILTIIAFIMSLYIFKKLPFLLVRFLISFSFFHHYKFLINGFENLSNQKGILLIGNHNSFLDWAIIQMVIPRKIHFIMDNNLFSPWYIKLFIKKFNFMSKNLEESLKLLNKGAIVCIFTDKTNYNLQNIILDQQIKIIPFHIKSIWDSSFDKNNEEFSLKNRSINQKYICIAFGKEINSLCQKEIQECILKLSFKTWQMRCETTHTITRTWIDCAKKNLSRIAFIDPLNNISFTYRKLLVLTFILSKIIKKNSKTLNIHFSRGSYAPKEECIGILLPNSFENLLCNLSILLSQKVIINLNYNDKNIYSIIQNSNIKQIYTSKVFFESLNLNFNDKNIHLIFMEDILKTIKDQQNKIFLYTLLISVFPKSLLKLIFSPSKNNLAITNINYENNQGIMFNNRNILSTIMQISDRFNLRNDDMISSSLPTYSFFGFIMTFLPILTGVKAIINTNFKNKIANQITIICEETNAFKNYIQTLNENTFINTRIILSGGKIDQNIKEEFESKFKKRIFSTFGLNELSPIISINTNSNQNNLGQILDGIAIKIDTDGTILLGGHQVMVGYLNNKKLTDEAIKEIDGIRWYNTKKIGYIDENNSLYML
ncbi:MFS transporter [Campylobacter sp. TTU_617]|uniref:MFS transporter n=1 Tax=Campylobacter sp. TTU_617 TaxID=2768148 RepID=UPI001F1C3ACB|nr:MFS transporter [Campylobacter sp. TTU_617]